MSWKKLLGKRCFFERSNIWQKRGTQEGCQWSNDDGEVFDHEEFKERDISEGMCPLEESKKGDKAADLHWTGHSEEVKEIKVSQEKDALVKET